ncbi:unnamed protein product [Schistosoma curassoni]|uniref:CIA30 domain-containing protein n=1 Tax=Schistosoma curassoni TaxID=6186 RepID=A0A183KDB8_9TREM|nr:unnamed protein product [Schistosoma curassoni]
MSIGNNSVAVLILTTLFLNTGNAMEEYSSQTDATQSFTISNNMMTTNFNRNSKPITLKQRNWIGVSDTFRVERWSIAGLKRRIVYNNQSAILYYQINSQPDGSGFAGVHYKLNNWNLSNFTGVIIEIRTHGRNPKLKLIFYGNCSEIFACQSYESVFETSGERQQIKLTFSKFKPHFHGQLIPNLPPLDLTQLSRFGTQVYGSIGASEKKVDQESIKIFSIIAYKKGGIPA